MRGAGTSEKKWDWQQTKVLIRNSLLMDLRARRTGRSGRISPLIMTLIFYGIMGISMSLSLVYSSSAYFYSLVILSYSMGMTVLTVMLEFGSHIIYPEDADILAFRPISSKTYFFSRLGHLLIFVTATGSALTLMPSLIGLGLEEAGWNFPFIFFATAFVANLTAAAFVVWIYTFLLKMLPYNRFKDVLTAFQVIYSFVIFFGYQLIPRLGQEQLRIGSEGVARWLVVWPPAWFAGTVHWMLGMEPSVHLGSVWPAAGSALVLFFFAFRKISLEYASSVASLQARPGRGKDTKMNESFWKKREWTDRILKHPETRAGYRLTSLMLKRERTLKAGVFPMLGMPLAFLVLAILDKRTIDPFSSCVSAGMGDMSVLMFIFTIYVLTMSMLYSPEWEAAWLFRVAPMTSPARLMMGMKMAVLFRLLLPLYLLLGIVYSFLMPVLHAWLYTASLFFLGVLAFGVVSFFIRAYPFSLKRERGDRVRRFGVLIFVLPFFGIMMIFQRFLYKNPMIGIAAHILIVPVYWILESIASRRLNRVLLA